MESCAQLQMDIELHNPSKLIKHESSIASIEDADMAHACPHCPAVELLRFDTRVTNLCRP